MLVLERDNFSTHLKATFFLQPSYNNNNRNNNSYNSKQLKSTYYVPSAATKTLHIFFNNIRGTAIIPILQKRKLGLRGGSGKVGNPGSLSNSEKIMLGCLY